MNLALIVLGLGFVSFDVVLPHHLDTVGAALGTEITCACGLFDMQGLGFACSAVVVPCWRGPPRVLLRSLQSASEALLHGGGIFSASRACS
jgi:hypothetical protein